MQLNSRGSIPVKTALTIRLGEIFVDQWISGWTVNRSIKSNVSVNNVHLQSVYFMHSHVQDN